jgi:hypothetical protein
MLNILVPGTLLTLISVVYLFGVAPDMSWLGLAGDSPDYVASSTLFQRAGLGGYPLYITIGWVFQQIFHYGLGFNPFWSLGLLSAISTVVTCGYIYASIRLFSKNSILPAILGTLAYPGSLLVWSQSVIPEVYTITAMFMVIGAYYFIKAYKEEKPRLLYISALVFGLSLCTHPLVIFALIPCLVYLVRVPLNSKPHIVKLLLVGLVGLVGWVQFLVSGDNVSYPGLGTDKVFWLFASAGFIGNLTVYPTQVIEYRIVDAFSIIGLSICILVPFYVLGLKDSYKADRSIVKLLLVLSLLPAVFYFTSRPPQWVTYVIPSVAFFSILGGVCASYYLERYSFKPSLVIASVCGLGLLGLNIWSYDIGRSIDPSPTTMRQAYTQLESFEPGTIVYSHTWGHLGVLTDFYNRFDRDTRKPDKLVRVDATNDNSFRQGAVRGTGVTVPDYEAPLLNLTPKELDARISEDLLLIHKLNPEREIYVAYLKDRTKIQFAFVPASDYRHSLNDVPQLSEATSRRIRVQ